MSRTQYHLHVHLKNKKRRNLLDHTALIASVAAPMTAIPQITKVFDASDQGVSLWAWLLLMPISLLFLFYGLVHDIKPMAISNFLWLIAEGFVVAGILIK